jgi:hypothetical protein
MNSAGLETKDGHFAGNVEGDDYSKLVLSEAR